MKYVQRYLRKLERELATGKATEHSHRPALQEFVESFRKKIAAINEPKRIECGAPDYIVSEDGVTVGYIEAKNIGANLNEVEKSGQLKRYLDGLPNLILTDYLEFRLYHAGEYVMEARLAYLGDNGKMKVNRAGADALESLLGTFLAADFPEMATPSDLADRMAATAKILRDVIERSLDDEPGSGTLHGQLEAFRQVLIHDLEAPEFADMYAQTICYGLFAARCNHKPSSGEFKREAAVYELPETNPFLRKMFGDIAGPQLDHRLSWAVDHLARLLHKADIGAVLKDFGKRTRQEDPVVHFYESFLAAYDPAMREARGVYYTPEPVVSYIVRSVDKILKEDFKIDDGLACTDKVPMYETYQGPKADKPGKKKVGEIHKVLVLDPATGTGTFLHGVVDHIYDAVTRKGKGLWSGYVSEHLLPRLFGFELLMAPYAVAHMKLGIQLAETGYDFKSGERLGIYLTNTLEEAFDILDKLPFAQIIAQESNEAGRIKQDYPVMVVMGNPPYSGHSQNKGKWIKQQLDAYKDGCPELKKPGQAKWLNDDYVKFIRFAQWRIENTGHGVLAFISNHGYLDNPTFRGMRQSLMDTFDDIYVLDLHGNAKKKETAPDGSKDDNVFDIQQGVAIGIFVKKKNGVKKKAAVVRHAELWGDREIYDHKKRGTRKLIGGKYHVLNNTDTTKTKWEKLKPQSPHYLFVPQDTELLKEYESATSICSIFKPYGDPAPGIVTTQDQFAISWSQEEAQRKIKLFLETKNEEEARRLFRLCSQSQWNYGRAIKELSQEEWKNEITPILYRPFDFRWTVYNRNVAVHRRDRAMRHMMAGENIGLSTTRSIEIGRGWEHVFCSRDIIQHHTVSLKEVNYLFPLYLYPKPRKEVVDIIEFAVREEAEAYGYERSPNLDMKFTNEFSEKLGLEFVRDGVGDLKKTFGPEDVFHYIYAIFHSPEYRERYAEFLKRDFPRVPLTSNLKLFRQLCESGACLVNLHLLEEVPKNEVEFPVPGENAVDKPRYLDEENRVYVNDAQYFANVPLEVWNFHVGGYQVCHKWLKDRKGRVLNYDDITHYMNIVNALGGTINTMAEIDAAIDKNGGWPIKPG